MDFRSAHRFREASRRFTDRAGVCLGLIGVALVFVSPALGDCGTPAGTVQSIAVDERMDIKLADGRLVRLGGLDLPRSERGDPGTERAARNFLTARLVGREVELNLLAMELTAGNARSRIFRCRSDGVSGVAPGR